MMIVLMRCRPYLFWCCVCGSVLLIPVLSHSGENRGQAPAVDLSRIVVTPSKIEEYYKTSPVDIDVIDAEDIALYAPSETTQLLDALPAVDIINFGSLGATKSVHIRGAGPSQIVTMMNGRPVSTPRDGLTDFTQIPFNNIDRIEVLKGPASSIYGANAIGGAVNIITKSGREKMFTELSLRTGSFFTRELNFAHGWKVRSFDYFFSNSETASEGFRENSAFKQHNYYLKLGEDLNAYNRVTLETGYTAYSVGTPGVNSNVDLDNKQQQFNNFFDMTWKGSCWKDTQVLIKAFRNMDRVEFIDEAPLYKKDTNQTEVYGLDMQISREWFDIFRTSGGLNGAENYLNSSTSAKHKYDFKATYGEAEFNLFRDLIVKGGARIDDYSNFKSRTSPSVSFSWLLFDKVKTHGLLAKSFRAPTFNDLYWPREDYGIWGGVEGNQHLKPEIAQSREIGIGTFLFSDKLETDVTYFNTKYKDMIAWQMDDTWWWRPSNINSAVIQGVESSISFQATDDIRCNFNYTRLSAINRLTNKWIIYRPRHQYKGRIDYTVTKKLNLGLAGRYKTKRYATEDNSRFLKDYFVADTNISYRIMKCAEITVSVNNIFNKTFQEEEDYPMPGISYMAGIKFTF